MGGGTSADRLRTIMHPENRHAWEPWHLQMFWPGNPPTNRLPVRAWVRECRLCGADEYLRLEGDETPDGSDEVHGYLIAAEPGWRPSRAP